MRTAFKEWAVVVDALALGQQVLILRKGGISEDGGAFRPDHERFLLFPTRFHQQRPSVIPSARSRHDRIMEKLPAGDAIRIEFLAEVALWRRIDSLAVAQRLRGQHIWTEEVVAKRFDGGASPHIFALVVRVSRLPDAVELPMAPSYGGCKSWVELERDIVVDGGLNVLSDVAFRQAVQRFEQTVGPA